MAYRWLTPKNSKGFTLLEVSLFLAVSAGLVVIAVAGLAPRLRNVRFTSAVKGVESAVDREFSVGGSFENNRMSGRTCVQQGHAIIIEEQAAGSSTGAAKNCVVAGRALNFSADRITARPVIALREPDPACSSTNGTLESFMNCFKPLVHPSDEETKVIEYQSGLTLTSINDQTLADREAAQINSSFAYMVHPQTGQRFIVQLNRSGTYYAFFQGSIMGTNPLALTPQTTFSTSLCFKLDNRQAKMTFSNTSLKPQTEIVESCV